MVFFGRMPGPLKYEIVHGGPPQDHNIFEYAEVDQGEPPLQGIWCGRRGTEKGSCAGRQKAPWTPREAKLHIPYPKTSSTSRREARALAGKWEGDRVPGDCGINLHPYHPSNTPRFTSRNVTLALSKALAGIRANSRSDSGQPEDMQVPSSPVG